MNWHVLVVTRNELSRALGIIRAGGGTVTSTQPVGDEIAVTYCIGEARLAGLGR